MGRIIRYKSLFRGIRGLVVLLVSGGLLVFLLQNLVIPRADIRALLTEPLPSPKNQGRNQVLVIRNDGNGPALHLRVKIPWPRAIQPSDYKIETSSIIEFQTRTDEQLRFAVDRLAPQDYLIVVVAVVGGSRIEPENISIVHDEGVVLNDSIESARTSRWRTMK